MKNHGKSKNFFLPLIFLAFTTALFSCASMPVRSYDEEVSTWKSYKDVQDWMSNNYDYDMQKAKKTLDIFIKVKKAGISVEDLMKYPDKWPGNYHVKTPEESFKEKKGICYDAAYFAQQTLNRIDPSYQAMIVFFEQTPYYTNNHAACAFKMNGKLYMMEYGVPNIPNNAQRRGVHGPFDSIEQLVEFHIQHHGTLKRIKSFQIGLPEFYLYHNPHMKN